jgi:hypothetical protein
MRIERIVPSFLLAAGLVAAVAVHAQEPPPYPGGADAQGADQAPPPPPDAANDPAAASDQYFHEQLQPYGQWVPRDNGPDVWVPRVAPGWRPYTSGHWAYTDQGWAWVADEPWGWAAFHYGRWDYDQELGWAWTPGAVWAPAWVAWRSGGGYLGWAPLPSRIGFTVGEGILGAEVITPGFFTFVAEQNILSPRIGLVILPSARNVIIVRETHDFTHYVMRDNHIYNSGVDVRHIETVVGHPVQVVRVAELAHGGANGRGAFYQPAVVTRAAAATHAEFGSAVRPRPVQAGAPGTRSASSSSKSARTSHGHTTYQPAPDAAHSTAHTNATPYHATEHAAPPAPKSQEKTPPPPAKSEKSEKSEEKPKQKPPV